MMKKVLFKLLMFFTKSFSGKGYERIPVIISIYKLIIKISIPERITLINCRGNKMYIDVEDIGVANHLLHRGVHEPFDTELFEKLVKENMTVIIIGANIGYYTLIAAKRVGPNGMVYAFEPDSKNYKLLVRNIEANNYKNVLPVQVAVSDKKGVLKLYLDKSNFASSSLAEQNIVDKNGFEEIETNSLDNLFEEYRKDLKADLIQMDTQGAEGLILGGAKKIIGNNRLKIIMEFWPYGLNNMGTDALYLLKRLKNYGFKIGLVDETNKCISYLLSEKIVEMCKNSKNGMGHVNLLLEK